MPPIAEAVGSPFYVTLALRILIFALAAASLNLVLGYGGLISFGHALYLGLGAYVVAILSFHGVTSGWLHLGVDARCCRRWSPVSPASSACEPAASPSS